MVLMALDHVRDYVTNVRFPPEDLSRGTAALFATRWLTHFCAPGFFLLAGLGVGISMQRGRGAAETSRYLLTRGAWLIFLEFTVSTIGWRFSVQLLPFFAIVIWTLGWSMIVLAALIHLPRVAVAAISLATIALHNTLDGIQPQNVGAFAPLWNFLHVPGFAIPGKLLIAYPLIPWFAVMALGFCLADLYRWEPARRTRFLLRVGAFAVAAFVILRVLNGYGDPGPWSTQRTTALTVASFFNVRKYPPSLLFLLMTLGPICIALALSESARGRVARWLSVYGRVPLFYYLVHIYVAHLMGMLLALAQGGVLMRIPATTDPASIPAWYGVSLPGVYAFWVAVVLIMYYPCRWFDRLKTTRAAWWLKYL